MLTAAAMTHNVNSSREPVLVTCQSSHGNRRRPTISMKAMKPPTWASVMKMVIPMLRAPSVALPPSEGASAGNSTKTKTMARSSTTSQPTAIRPSPESTKPRLSRALSKTTVLATESEMPKTSAEPRLHPQKVATPAPKAVATAICTTAPGRAIFRTAIRSSTEKCKPTPNMRSITPTSASCDAI